MGASSSSGFWVPIQYYHPQKDLNALYEKNGPIKVIHQVQFNVQDALNLLHQKNMFPDITLILDIDMTLGEALTIRYDNFYGFLLNEKPINYSVMENLVYKEKAAWFHNKACLFFLRPYFKEFIQFCDNNFKEVIIWTNGVEQHAKDMVDLVESKIGKRWQGYDRRFSTYDRKIVTKIGLEPSKTWLVDDDHRHYNRVKDRDESVEVNPDIKFFHGPEFSVSYFKDFMNKIDIWGNELELYDDWFLFLIWNWNYMKQNNMDIEKYVIQENKFIY